MSRVSFRRWFSIAAVLVLLILLVPGGQAQVSPPYSVAWFTIAGGGGTSTIAGSYSVSGTLGQPAVGLSSGGGFSLKGGFWGSSGTPPVPPSSTPPPGTAPPLPGRIDTGQSPKVDGSIVVWEDNHTGSWNIFGKDLSSGQALTITLATSDQRHPVISGDLVVWQGNQTGAWHIYGARLIGDTVGSLFTIYTGPGDQINPAVSNNVVVWQSAMSGSNRWDISGKDLTSGQVFTLTTPATTNLNPALDFTILADTPPSSGILTGTVIWQSTVPTMTLGVAPSTNHWAIMGASKITSTARVFTVTNDLIDHTNPAISGSVVVWQESISSTWRIAGTNLIAPHAPFTITGGLTDNQINPSIHGTTVVFQDSHTSHALSPVYHHRWAILSRELSRGLIEPVSNSPYTSTNPSLSNSYIVWEQTGSGSGSGSTSSVSSANTYIYGTVCTSVFSDVPPSQVFYRSIHWLACNGILSGYNDGTFQPGNTATRGQIAKIIANARGLQEVPVGQRFADVPPVPPFYTFIERIAAHGIISGYDCGSPGEPCDAQHRPYFRPANNVTRAQIAKIIANAWSYQEVPVGQRFADVPPAHPFYTFIERIAAHGIISGYDCGGVGEPCDAQHRPYFRPANNATRGQIAKIIYGAIGPP